MGEVTVSGSRPCLDSPPADRQSSRCRLVGAQGPTRHHAEQQAGLGSTSENYWPEPGFGVLRALHPSHRAEALSSVSFSKGEKTRLLERRGEGKAQGLPPMPRSCQQPQRVHWKEP